MALDRGLLQSLSTLMQEGCYEFVHNEAKLGEFFEEDGAVVARRAELVKITSLPLLLSLFMYISQQLVSLAVSVSALSSSLSLTSS